MPEFFPLMNVRDVDFNGRKADGGDGVPKGNAGVSVGGGVEDDDIETPLRLLNPSDQLPFLVRLAEVDGHSQFGRPFADEPFNVREGRPSIDFRLADAEQIQIGPVEEEHFHSGGEPRSGAEGCRWDVRNGVDSGCD